MEVHVGCIVEGHGDREAVPVLIRRIAERLDPALVVHVASPIRTPKSKLIKPGELERAVDLASRKISGRGAVFIWKAAGHIARHSTSLLSPHALILIWRAERILSTNATERSSAS